MDKPSGEGTTKQQMMDCYIQILSKVLAKLFMNREIVRRPPERQRRVEPVPQRHQDRPRYNDRTRYNRHRVNMRC